MEVWVRKSGRRFPSTDTLYRAVFLNRAFWAARKMSFGNFPFPEFVLRFRVRTCAWQLDTPEDHAVVEREWAMLTRAFLSKWSEVTEESFTTEVMVHCSAAVHSWSTANETINMRSQPDSHFVCNSTGYGVVKICCTGGKTRARAVIVPPSIVGSAHLCTTAVRRHRPPQCAKCELTK